MQSILAPEASFSAEKSVYQVALQEAESVLRLLSTFESTVRTAAQWCLEAFQSGNKLLVLGNGGSACEAQHLVGELMGRYLSHRRPLPAVALTVDTAVLTCIGNDFCYEEVFARQIEGLGRPAILLSRSARVEILPMFSGHSKLHALLASGPLPFLVAMVAHRPLSLIAR